MATSTKTAAKKPASKKAAAKKPAATKKPAVKSAAAKKAASAPRTSGNSTFEALRAILERHARELVVMKDDATWYYLDTQSKAPNGKPLFFAGVRNGKAYTSFYLMPVYSDPKLVNGLSAGLKKRMQGKSCFNFKQSDEPLLAELSALTKKCFETWKKSGLIKPA